jgi:carboxymethylenebutenolidase
MANFLANPPQGGPSPGVVLIQEWWGLNDHIKDIARRLASEGFVVVAPDLYDGKVTKDPSEAGSMMQSLDQKVALQKLNDAVQSLQTNPDVKKGKVGVIGFCMGGSLTLALAGNNNEIGAAVPFYGKVPDDNVLQSLNAPVMYIYAGKDQWITRQEVGRLDQFLKKSGKTGEVMRYTNANHAFFNDTRPEVYKADDAKDAWNRAVGFLKKHLGSN